MRSINWIGYWLGYTRTGILLNFYVLLYTAKQFVETVLKTDKLINNEFYNECGHKKTAMKEKKNVMKEK